MALYLLALMEEPMNVAMIFPAILTLVSVGLAYRALTLLSNMHAQFDAQYQQALSRSPVRGEQFRHKHDTWVAIMRIVLMVCLGCALFSFYLFTSRIA
jgi:hypothetical protein